MMLRSKRLVLCAISLAAFCGCHHTNTTAVDPLSPPPYPKPKEVALDPDLQAAARKQVLADLGSDDELLRTHALETLKDVHIPDANHRVMAALNDRSLLVRKAAAIAAGEMNVQEAMERLPALLNAEALDNPAESTYGEQQHIAAIFAMYKLGDTSHAHDLEKTAMDSRAPVRADTALVLGLMGNTTALDILDEMRRHDIDGNVRLQAAEAMWRLGDDRGLTSLVAATISVYASDQMIALLALAEPHDTRVLGNVEGFLTADYPEVALVAARAAGMLGSDDGYGVATIGVNSPDPRQRALAAMAFGAIGRNDAQPMLAKLLKDREPEVRLAAADALGLLADKSDTKMAVK